MALRTVHHIAGQSNARGAAAKVDLTDDRYDLDDADVQSVYKADTDSVVGPETMTIHSSNFSVDAAIGHRRKAAGEALPLVMRYGRGGTSLASSWRPYVSSGDYVTYMSTWWERYDHCRRSAFAGDTFEHRSFTWVQGEADAQSSSNAAAYEANLRQLIEIVRHDLAPNLPIFLVRLSINFTADGVADPDDVATVRAAFDAVAADTARVYSIDADSVPLQDDETHYTADGYMQLGDLIADAMALDGLSGVTQYTRQMRVFGSSEDAGTFGSSAQSEQGDRDEDPAEGGFGVRLGDGCQDPWPTTARSAVMKHPYRDEWGVLIDDAMDADGDLDCETDRRPVDASWWRYV